MAKKVLIVDDSSSVRTVARMALRERGYEVIEASNGKEALEKLDSERCHLVISDVNMPTMDGITLLKEIKRHPNYKFTPVIMLTTTDDPREMHNLYHEALHQSDVAAYKDKLYELARRYRDTEVVQELDADRKSHP